MKKVLFCSKYGLDPKNSIGGHTLRIKTSIESLSKICELSIVSRNVRYGKLKKLDYLKKDMNFFLAPSARKAISNNFFKFAIWRFKEIFYLKQDANYLVDLYKKNNCDCIWISYASQSYNIIKRIKKIDPLVKIVADTDSVFSKFLERRMKYVKYFSKILLYFYCIFLKSTEKKMLMNSDIVTTVSEYDKKIFKKLYPRSKIMIFRNAVNILKSKKIKHKGLNILISGTFGDKKSPMNVSTRWFLDKIYPLFKDKVKNLKIFIVGINSKKEFKSNEKIFVKDWVADIRKYFFLCDIAAVPLKYESGTRFKILEAGAYNLPVISTSLGAEGLNYKKNKSILIANDEKNFAKKIILLSKNVKLRKKLAKENYRIVKSKYSIDSIKNDGLKILSKIG